MGTSRVLEILERRRQRVFGILRRLREAQNDEAMALAKQSMFRAELAAEVGETDAALILRTLAHFVDDAL